jgi:hypothetical protein
MLCLHVCVCDCSLDRDRERGGVWCGVRYHILATAAVVAIVAIVAAAATEAATAGTPASACTGRATRACVRLSEFARQCTPYNYVEMCVPTYHTSVTQA